MHLHEDAAQRPDVDGDRVRQPEHDLGRPVEPGLDVGVHAPVALAGAPKVDDLDGAPLRVAQQDVLGLEVAVDHGHVLRGTDALARRVDSRTITKTASRRRGIATTPSTQREVQKCSETDAESAPAARGTPARAIFVSRISEPNSTKRRGTACSSAIHIGCRRASRRPNTRGRDTRSGPGAVQCSVCRLCPHFVMLVTVRSPSGPAARRASWT